MRTNLSVGLLGGALMLIAFAFLAQSWRALVLVLPIVLYLGMGAMLAPPEVDVAVTRDLSRDRAAVGQRVDVRVRLKNRGRRIASLEVFDNLAQGLRIVEGRPHVHLDLAAGASVNLKYAVEPSQKGEYAIGPVLLRAREPLGLSFEETRAHEDSRLVVAPRMEDVRKVHVTPRRTRAPLGLVRSRQIGLGLEFFSLREYLPGDEIRHVNWKASARRDRLLTNEYEIERSGDTIILLDARREAEVGPVWRTTTEWGVTATVSLAAKILETRNRVGVVVQREMLVRVPPGYGKRQLYRILDSLVRVQAGGEWSLRHVAWLLLRFFPKDAQIVIVTPMLDREAVDVVAELRGRGFDVLVVSPSPLEVERAMYPEDPLADLAYRVLKMERDAAIQSLRRHADVVDWDPSEPLALALKGVRPYPRRR